MMRFLYNLLLWAALPYALWHLWWRGRRQPEYLQHVGERFGRCAQAPPRPLIWIHAVSVGETRAAAPLVRQLRERHPDHAILLTHMTPTGRATGEELFGADVLRCYLPYDYPWAVRRFLDHFRPRLGIIMETELWPNLILTCRGRGIPVFLVNARLSEKSARGYARAGSLTRAALEALAGISAQTEADAERLRALGAPTVEVSGSVKFDIAPPPEQLELGGRLRERFGAQRPVLLAASTREGEEALLLDALERARVPGLLAVIVPRHPQRFDAVAELLAKRGIPFQRRSEEAAVARDTRVVLGDSMGEMFAYYAACDLAFVGGSLLPLGGQNLIEACAVGKPVLVGPHTFNFEEATRLAIEGGAAARVADAAELGEALNRLLRDENARQAMGQAGLAFAARHRGATARILRMVEPALGPTSTRN
ncbi:MAG TPA: lipid IV(A) 3-deoxy-D-manno-octulosonic acid transferase [Burkholderiales bacterium]|nr:lipid IV(A) 3-deoxy-D-manno-octulosonic acid transferase [Burkholderiales bacterium]